METWGGIANAVAALGRIAAPGDTIVPVCPVAEEDHAAFLRWLAGIPAVDPSGVYAVAEPTNRMAVYHQTDGEKVACVEQRSPSIPFDRLRKHLGADAVLINMSSGTDIAIDTLDMVRMEVRGKKAMIHIDFHNLTTHPGPDKVRQRTAVPEWRRWAFMTDSVQMNQEELQGLSPERLTEAQAVGHLLSVGSRAVIITRGAPGLTVYTSEHKKIIRNDIPGSVYAGVAQPYAPGDVFGAGFLFHAAGGEEYVSAAKHGIEAVDRAAAEPLDRRRR